MDSQNIISIREFARRVSSSEGNIRKAIKSGKISKGLSSNGKIIYDVAIDEYKTWYGHKMPEPLITEKPKIEKSEKVKDVKVKKTIIKKESVTPELKVIKMSSVIQTIPEEADTTDPNEDIPIRIRNSTRYEEAKRLESVIKTRTAQLEYEQLKGSLVSSKEVYKELYAVGQTVRSAMQGIPDKYIDNLLACETRSEAHEMLTKAITQALEELSNATKEVEI